MQHLAMIMDGNRRWARSNKLKVFQGHKRGLDNVKMSVEFCIENEIKHLSLYTFSLENFRRSPEEKGYLFRLLNETMKKNLDDFVKEGVKIRFVGDKNLFPQETQEAIANAEEKTKDLKKLCLNLLFCYGSKQELVHAAKKIAQKAKDGSLDPDSIDESLFREEFWLQGPDPDLIIRTGDTVRTSNFLLFQGAYSEWMFLKKCWPEMNKEILSECYEKFRSLKRNFGR